MYVKLYYNYFEFLKGDTESDLGKTLRIGRIVPNIFYNQFQEKPLWVSDKRVELDVIRIYAGYIDLPIQWCEHIPWISGSDLF